MHVLIIDIMSEVFMSVYPALTWKNDANILSIKSMMGLQLTIETNVRARSHLCNMPSPSQKFPKINRALGSLSRNQFSASESTPIHRSCLGSGKFGNC